jgi:hypothetical protein
MIKVTMKKAKTIQMKVVIKNQIIPALLWRWLKAEQMQFQLSIKREVKCYLKVSFGIEIETVLMF